MFIAGIKFNKLDKHKLINFSSKFPKVMDGILAKTSSSAKIVIIRNTPVKTGLARRAWVVVKQATHKYVIEASQGAGAAYMNFLDKGTGLFGPKRRRIKPKRAKQLTFPIIVGNTVSRWVSVASTKGMKPKKIIANSIEGIGKKFKSISSKDIRAIWDKGKK